MKRIIVLAGLLVAFVLPMAGEHITLTSPGSLGNEIAKLDLSRFEYYSLFISGPMDESDFASLRELCYASNCQSVNLANARIEGDAIPPNAFFDQSNGADSRTNLACVYLPDGLREIGERAFYNVPLRFVNFPTTLEAIGDEAFAHTMLPSAILPDKCTSLGEGVFSNSLISEIRISERVTDIPARFAESSSLMNLSLPAGVERIGENAFHDCSSLRGIVLPETVSVIGKDAFLDGYDLEEIDLPASLTKIAAGAFIMGPRAWMKTIKCRAVTPPECEVVTSGSSTVTNILTPFEDTSINMPTISPSTPVYVPVGSSAAYREASGWKYFQTFIETDDFEAASLPATPADSTEKPAIRTDGDKIIVEATTPGHVTIVTPDGRSLLRHVPAGTTIITDLQPGVYIVNATKIALHK